MSYACIQYLDAVLTSVLWDWVLCSCLSDTALVSVHIIIVNYVNYVRNVSLL